jgi:hypothetical protein
MQLIIGLRQTSNVVFDLNATAVVQPRLGAAIMMGMSIPVVNENDEVIGHKE